MKSPEPGQSKQDSVPLVLCKISNILSSIISSNTTILEEESPCITFTVAANASIISKFFDTTEKEDWLDTHQDKLKELIQDTLFDKTHFVTENYEILKRRLEECMSL